MRNTEGQDLRKTPSQVALVVKHLPVSASDLTLGFDSWVTKILGGGNPTRQPTPVFLPGESRGLRSLASHCVVKSWTGLKLFSMRAHAMKELLIELTDSDWLTLTGGLTDQTKTSQELLFQPKCP